MPKGRPGNHASAKLRQDHQHQLGGRRLGPTVQRCELRLQVRDWRACEVSPSVQLRSHTPHMAVSSNSQDGEGSVSMVVSTKLISCRKTYAWKGYWPTGWCSTCSCMHAPSRARVPEAAHGLWARQLRRGCSPEAEPHLFAQFLCRCRRGWQSSCSQMRPRQLVSSRRIVVKKVLSCESERPATRSFLLGRKDGSIRGCWETPSSVSRLQRINGVQLSSGNAAGGPLIGFVGYTPPSPCRAQRQEPAFYISQLSLKRRGMLGSSAFLRMSARSTTQHLSARCWRGGEDCPFISPSEPSALEYSQCRCQSWLSARFLCWYLPWREVFLKGYETRAPRTPEALAKIFCMNVARTFEQPGLLEKGPYYCSLHCRCEFACFRLTPAFGPENTVLSTHIRCMFFFSCQEKKYFLKWILSEFNGGEFWSRSRPFAFLWYLLTVLTQSLNFQGLQRSALFWTHVRENLCVSGRFWN